MQVGIVSWGIGCYTTIPGVYADVSKANCFIDWASRCVDGTDADHFGMQSGCTDDWGKASYCDQKNRIDELEAKLINLKSPREKGRTEKKLHNLRALLQPYEQAILGCKRHGSQTLDCSDNRGR